VRGARRRRGDRRLRWLGWVWVLDLNDDFAVHDQFDHDKLHHVLRDAHAP
jgi:hypothetical protein